MVKSIEELKSWARDRLKWFGQSAFRISSSDQVIFIDPFRVPATWGPADLILITHPHPDHYDRRAVSALRQSNTVAVLPASCAEPGQRGMAPGQTETINKVRITAVASYNLRRHSHPKSGGWLGFLIEIDGVRLYHAGDTDPIPEMADLRPDIALLPVGGGPTMDWRAAALSAQPLKATLSIPMHFNFLLGGRKAGERFCHLAGQGSLILEKERGNAHHVSDR